MLGPVNPNLAFIPARSEKQAMEWSLVLASQGMEPVISHDPASAAWGLAIESDDRDRATRAIEQYTAENRRTPWQQPLPWTGMVLDYRCVLWVLFLVFVFGLEFTNRLNLVAPGWMTNPEVRGGEWWRVFTAVTLHADPAHLALNAVFGFLLIGLTMGAIGPGFGLLLSYLAGATGNLAGLLLHDPGHRGLGASGMVLGALGVLAAQWPGLMKQGVTAGDVALRGAAAGCLLFMLLGFNPAPRVDYLAHVGGFVAGFVLGLAHALGPPALRRNARADAIALVLFVTLVLLPWWLALRKA
jgi:membrane associated rhomboid family serine protease